MEQEGEVIFERTEFVAEEDPIFIRQVRACIAAGGLALAAEVIPAILLVPIHHSFTLRQQQLFAFIDGPLLPLGLLAIFISAGTSIILGHIARDRQSAMPHGLITAGLSFAYIALVALILLVGWVLLRYHI